MNRARRAPPVCPAGGVTGAAVAVRTIGRVLTMATALVALLSTPVHAHPVLKRSEPASGASIIALRRLLLEFNEGIELAAAHLALRSATGLDVSLSPVRHEGGTGRALVADVVSTVSPGSYVLDWTIVGRDGHPTRGRLRFDIVAGAATGDSAAARGSAPKDSSPSGPPGDTAAGPAQLREFTVSSPLYVLVRLLTYTSLIGVLGAMVLILYVAPRATDLGEAASAHIVDNGRRFAIASATILAIAAVLRLIAQAMATGANSAGGQLVELVTGTTWGRAWLLQLAGIVVILVFARRDSAWSRRALGTACVALPLSVALSGHALASTEAGLLLVPLDALHIMAAAGWAGTLVALVVTAVSGTWAIPQAARDVAVRDLFRIFSPLALACGGTLALTGFVAAWVHLGRLEAVLGDAYGRTLLLKLAAVAAVAAIGAFNWRVVQPRLGSVGARERLLRTTRLEIGFAMLVLLVTAILAATPPPA